MGKDTGISWAHDTFNPWWGCWKIADECKNCYADATAHRYASQFGELWGRTAPRRFFGDHHWGEPLKWNKAAEAAGERRRVFCGSMCDWAELHPDPAIRALMDAARARLFALIKATPWLDWLLLTKRIENVPALLPWGVDKPSHQAPWANVWIGVTAGTRGAMRTNVTALRAIRAEVRFVSCEPMLEDIDADTWDVALASRRDVLGPVHLLIVGDESGPGARPAEPDWIRHAREAALRHGVAFHFKQWAGRDVEGIEGRKGKGRKIHLPILDGKQWAEFPK